MRRWRRPALPGSCARPPYQQTEVYRFGNAIVDDWEGRVNSWPLDEGLIDYVDASYGTESDTNTLYVVNVIANPTLTIGGETVDATHDHAGASPGQPAGGGGQRGQRRHRLPRHRVPALGAGPQRHRCRRRQASGDRLRCGQLHRRQLRAPRAVPQGGVDAARLRPRGDGRRTGPPTARRGRRSPPTPMPA